MSAVLRDMGYSAVLRGMGSVPYCAARAPEDDAAYKCGVGAGMVITQSAGKCSSSPHF